jgi:hypothetical protein
MHPTTRRTTRRAAGIAAALVSLLLVAAPTLAAKPPDTGTGGGQGNVNGGGNSGSVKVVDADSGVESTTDNDPHVCSFYLHFHDAPDGASGTWTIVDWPPTGSGDEVASGTYLIPPAGSYATDTMDLDAGHYRVNWQGINANSEKHKTFWVDECDEAEESEEQPEEEPEEEPEEQPEEEPEEEPEEQPEEEPEEEPEGDVEESVEELPEEEEEPDQQSEEQPDEEADEEADTEHPEYPDGGSAPSITDEPIVDELPDSAMSPPGPVLPGLGAAALVLLMVIGHRIGLDRERATSNRS